MWMVDIAEVLEKFYKFITITCFISVPLAIWKIIDIIIWLIQHFRINII